MLRKANRLRRSREFQRVRAKGRGFATDLLIMNVRRGASADVRVGFTASKRVGKATVRNRVKRLMREGVRANLMEAKPGHDLIFTARPPAASSSYREIRQAIEELLRRAGVLNQPNS